jgi:hypothetical protein
VNNGTNRWSLKPELGLSKAWGPLTAELSAAARFFSDNDDFLGESAREQDPIYLLQGHLIYGFRSGIWLAFTGTYLTGGRTEVDGVKNDDFQSNSRLGLTLALPVSPRHSVKLYAGTGVATRTGADFDLVGIAWQYRWGGGLQHLIRRGIRHPVSVEFYAHKKEVPHVQAYSLSDRFEGTSPHRLEKGG